MSGPGHWRPWSLYEDEFDADLQWRPKWKFFKGLWFRVRYANVHQYD
jgi:hypothetical protein